MTAVFSKDFGTKLRGDSLPMWIERFPTDLSCIGKFKKVKTPGAVPSSSDPIAGTCIVSSDTLSDGTPVWKISIDTTNLLGSYMGDFKIVSSLTGNELPTRFTFIVEESVSG